MRFVQLCNLRPQRPEQLRSLDSGINHEQQLRVVPRLLEILEQPDVVNRLNSTLLVGMPSAVPTWSIWAGLIVALSIGVFFGVYPARKAAMLDPIAALRFET